MAHPLMSPAGCPAPFVNAADYPYVAGESSGRLCQTSPLDPSMQCCLPCPMVNAIYPSNFAQIASIASWLSVPGLAFCVILLISFVVLPAQNTSRHYLSIGLVVSIMFLELAFIVPLGTQPNQCYDAITPNNMKSDASCAISGSFLLFGGFGGVMWVFIRSLFLHLQICWKVIPGDAFFYLAQIGGWGATLAFLAAALAVSGVSYRMGDTCHINHANSIGSFWGPLLGFAGLALLLQLVTFAYCVRVYLQVADGQRGLPSSGTSMSGTMDSTTSTSRRGSVAKRATYRRVHKVIALQWRGMTVVLLVVITACYLATVFLILDKDTQNAVDDPSAVLTWVACLAENQGDKAQCLPLTSSFALKEEVVLPVLFLLSIIGFWCMFFLGRWAMVTGWYDLFTYGFEKSRSRPSGAGRIVSQQAFSDKMHTLPPQQLHMIKGEHGLSVVDKTRSVDVESVMADRSDISHRSRDFDDYDFSKETEDLWEQQPKAVRLPSWQTAARPARSHVSFNFSRPGQPQSTTSSNVSDSWYAPNQGYGDEMALSPPPLRPALNRISMHERVDGRPRAGLSWDPENSYATPVTTVQHSGWNSTRTAREYR